MAGLPAGGLAALVTVFRVFRNARLRKRCAIFFLRARPDRALSPLISDTVGSFSAWLGPIEYTLFMTPRHHLR
ncbi:MAG TPA: hypothetical protein VEG08_01360, partial [Terriglobales bacterium]|nr:hypothetical protein [Terriglobales bacterium]